MSLANGVKAEAALPEPAPEAVARRLRDVEAQVDPREISEVWIFPPLPELEDSSEFVLFTRYVADGRRRLYTAGLRRRGSAFVENGGGDDGPETRQAQVPENEVTEHGVVPADRLPRLLERFRRRIGREHEPVHVSIGGSVERWGALVAGPGSAEDPAADTARDGDRLEVEGSGAAPADVDAGPASL